IDMIRDRLDTSNLNLDGSHAMAKKGGDGVAYQGRKRAKTSNILPMIDCNLHFLAYHFIAFVLINLRPLFLS
ncbi:MAG: hypothetical protein WAU96_15155, partial [Anaerolineae bacterium]